MAGSKATRSSDTPQKEASKSVGIRMVGISSIDESPKIRNENESGSILKVRGIS
jgi:hypothetical protein